MKKALFITSVILLILISSITLANGSINTPLYTKSPKIVTVEATTEELCHTTLDYVGIVKARETKNYAFMTGGKLETLYVNKGDYVHAGEKLAALDKTVLELNRQSAVTALSNIATTIDAAKTSLDLLESVMNSNQILYESSALSAVEWDATQAEYKMQKSAYENLIGNYQISQIQLNALDENINNTVLTADSDGYIMVLPHHEGEIVASGYPVAVIKSTDFVVTIGISTKDYSKIEPSTQVLINGNIAGKILELSAYPSEKDQTYAIDIQFDSTEVAIGQTVDVTLLTGKENSVLIPLSSVFNIAGVDYVYKVDSDGFVSKQKVELDEVIGDKIKVRNLSTGIFIVTEDIKSLKENDQVAISTKKEGSIK